MDEKDQGEACGPFFPNLEGAKVVSIELSGGAKYGRDILILFDNNRTLKIEAELSVSIYGIRPQIKYEMGGWFKGSKSPAGAGNTGKE